MENRENGNVLKGQHIIAQGITLGLSSGRKIVRGIISIIEQLFFRTKTMIAIFRKILGTIPSERIFFTFFKRLPRTVLSILLLPRALPWAELYQPFRLGKIASFIAILALAGCHSGNKPAEEAASKVTTPVTVTSVSTGTISKVINLTATSSYLKKNTVKSTATGYITKISCNIGEYVKAGSPLYSVKTKEAEALSSFSKSNPEFAFNGELTIKAPTSGIISEVIKQANDYVADGDELCVIAEQSSLVFLLNVPFEQNKHAAIGTSCEIVLPDSTRIQGTISSKLSAIDAVSQTQSFVVKPRTNSLLPENLTASVQISESTKSNTQITEKNCVLTDETMENFWVTKLINDSTAVKIAVKTGIVTDNQVEILSPQFDKLDRLINSGHYGLPDTALVNIIQP